MLVAAELAVARGTLPAADRDALARADRADGAAAGGRRPRGRRVVEADRRDKKVIAGTLHFVLPTAIGVDDDGRRT